MAPPSEGSFLLYVLPTCSHCDSAAIAFAMAVQRSGAHGLIVAGSGTKEAEEYRRRLDLPAMGTDSAREFARVAGIRVVPTLLRTRNGATVVTPAQSARWVRAQVEKH